MKIISVSVLTICNVGLGHQSFPERKPWSPTLTSSLQRKKEFDQKQLSLHYQLQPHLYFYCFYQIKAERMAKTLKGFIACEFRRRGARGDEKHSLFLRIKAFSEKMCVHCKQQRLNLVFFEI